MTKLKTILLALALGLGSFMAIGSAHAEGVMHKVAIHVDENDPKRMNMALNNAANIEKYYKSSRYRSLVGEAS